MIGKTKNNGSWCGCKDGSYGGVCSAGSNDGSVQNYI